MPAIQALESLLRAMNPVLVEGDVVFCHVTGALSQHVSLNPIATCREPEGLTLVLAKACADATGLKYDGTFRQITLMVNSSLHAVGLTAAVSAQLAANGISANVIAAYHHDHIFVPSDKAEQALSALKAISR